MNENRTDKLVDNEFLDNNQAAEFLGITVKTLIKYRKHEGLPVHYLGSRPRYLRQELYQWVLFSKPKKCVEH